MNLEDQFNFTNKLSHPTRKDTVVYRFYKQEQAEYFSQLLLDDGIDFEAQIDEEDQRKPTYFGVGRAYETRVNTLNFIALGHQRDKFIASPVMRWMIILVSALVLGIAIAGFLLDK